MSTYVALLGGINVGGHRVKMDELCTMFTNAGCRDVSSFIASGNLVFTTAKRDRAALETALARYLETELGYRVPTFLRTLEELKAVIHYEPFDREEIEANDYRLHVCFLHRVLTEAERTIVTSACNTVDHLQPHASEVYWLCRGKLTDSQINWKKLAKSIGESTARNITMLRKLVDSMP